VQFCRKRYRETHKDKIRDYGHTYYKEHKLQYEKKCVIKLKKIRTEEDIQKSKEYKKQYRKEHKDETADYNKKYYEEHKSYYHEKNKNYQETHKLELVEKRKKYCIDHREQIQEYNKKWYQENSDYKLQWFLDHPNCRKQWAQNNKEKVVECNKNYRIKNSVNIREYRRKYRQTSNGKISTRKNNSKRKRELGFNPLNNYFYESEGHHINKIDIIFIPYSLHKEVSHNVYTNKNMEIINTIAFFFLMMQNIDNLIQYTTKT